MFNLINYINLFIYYIKIHDIYFKNSNIKKFRINLIDN